ncbi:MAG: hypothetical protein HY321_10240, partial [Armatimonadetes bacterium]|nr:hypothetical protein [Armatimonadota bacterium]
MPKVDLARWQWRLRNGLPMIGRWLQRRAARALAAEGTPRAASALAEAVAYSDDVRVRSIALDFLGRADDQSSIDAACGVWAATRHSDLAALITSRGWVATAPLAVRVLTALAVGRIDAVAQMPAEGVPALIHAHQDRDPEIAVRAHQVLLSLSGPGAIDRLCAEWVRLRAPVLEALVAEAGYVAQQPMEVRVLTALKTGHPELVADVDAEGLHVVFQARGDRDPRICAHAHQALLSLSNAGAVDRLCAEWAHGRDPVLEGIVSEAGYVAKQPMEVRVMTALKAGRPELVADVDAERLPLLFKARGDRDPEIVTQAYQALISLSDPGAIDRVCAEWVRLREPVLEALVAEAGYVAQQPMDVRLLTALKAGRPELVSGTGADGLPLLFQAHQDADPKISAYARQALLSLSDSEAIDRLCAEWARLREPVLEGILAEAGYVAQQPMEVRVLTALKTGRLEFVVGLGADVVGLLLGAIQDADPTIARAGQEALAQLEHPDAREDVCQRVIQGDHPTVQRAAVAGGYVPRDESGRALFLFLTEQWERYDSVDFDQRILRSAYHSGDAALRQRVMQKVRVSGRTDYLTVIATASLRERASTMAEGESEIIIEMLIGKQQWKTLWSLAFDLPLTQSTRILRCLARAGWRPDGPDERSTFEGLGALAAGEMMLSHEEAKRVLPPAVRRALASASARVNDIAFCPTRPSIAIGTSLGRVVLWDFQRAAHDAMLSGFPHSIGRVAFTGDGTLICGERTRGPEAICALHGWRNGESFTLGNHQGSVTAIEPLGASQLVTAGRDGRVAVWDTVERRKVRDAGFPDWARGMCLSPDKTRAALLHAGLTLVALPGLETLATCEEELWDADALWGGTGYGRGVARAAAFSPEGDVLVFGKHNGDVRACSEQKSSLVSVELLRHKAQIQGIASLPEPAVVITASSDGDVRFTSWHDKTPIGSVQVVGQRLTTIRVSPDGSFMVVGDSDTWITLWDLRPLDIPSLLGRPLARALPVHLAAAGTLLEVPGLP